MTTRPIVPVEWRGDSVRLLDQRLLPHRKVELDCRTIDEVCDAIRALAIRGAPVLGVTAAYGLALVACTSGAHEPAELLRELESAANDLAGTRPTAVNISWAAERVRSAAARGARASSSSVALVREAIVSEALAIEREDRDACEAIGGFGADLVTDGSDLLTHCNTGMLCTAGIGTAQGVIYAAHRAGKRIHVWVDETRPVWQGARLTAWELGMLGIPRTLIADGAAASLMAEGRVDAVITGADRIAADGSVANKVGTYGLAVLAKHHGVPFYVAAPMSTVDLATADAAEIPIEHRDPAEITAPLGRPLAAAGTPAANPAFDITPPELVSAIVTERGVARKPYASALREATGAGRSA